MEIVQYTQSTSTRVDARLASQFSSSRNFFQHIIQRGGVQVASAGGTIDKARPVKKSYKLVAGDTVVIEDLERFLDGGILEECVPLPVIGKDDPLPTATNTYLRILHQTADYMVIYKAKGVLSHPNSVRDVEQPSVVGGLYHYMQSSSANDILPSTGNFMRAGLVHRLDKDTDGLMIIAKTEAGLAHFKSLFQQKSAASSVATKENVPLKKRYRTRCIISSAGKQFLEGIEILPHLIAADVIAKVPYTVSKMGYTKILDIQDKKYKIGDTIDLHLEILTGRTHQIRYHLSQHGLPIVGDYLYGQESSVGMQLTAYKLAFADLEGVLQTISL